MDEIKEIREALDSIRSEFGANPAFPDTIIGHVFERIFMNHSKITEAVTSIEAYLTELTKDRDYWQALAMQFHDAVHAEIERRAKVEI